MNVPGRANICTIVAKNYLAHARTLSASFLRHHPDGKCFVLVIDDDEELIDASGEKFKLLRLSELGLEELPSWCFRYTILELSTAVKPFFIRFLFEKRGLDSLLYLDPDILVTASLDPLYSRLSNGTDLLVTPHLDTDYPDDGLMPDDNWIMMTGVFNLGFLGIRASARSKEFLTWLEGKLYSRCLVEPHRNYFVDQRFFDLAITLFPEIEIERSIGYNVAYWNLHSRHLEEKAGEGWRVNGETMRFYHFSDYRPSNPDSISGYLTRYRLRDRPDLQALFSFYRAELYAHGYEKVSKLPYAYARFSNGEPISDAIRREYREDLLHGRGVEDPFASSLLLARAVTLARKQKLKSVLRNAASRFDRFFRNGKVQRLSSP